MAYVVMDDIRDKSTIEGDEEEDIRKMKTQETDEDGGPIQKCNSMVDRQSSYSRDETFEEDNQDGTEAGNVAEARVQMTEDVFSVQVQEPDMDSQTYKLKNVDKEANEEADFKSEATAEEENKMSDSKIRQEKTAELSESFSGSPTTDIKSNRTVDDDVENATPNMRSFRTEEDLEEPDVYTSATYKSTTIVFKTYNVRVHEKNKVPVSKMIGCLPSEPIIKRIGQCTLMGRGDNQDISLYDIIASRDHVKFEVLSERGKSVVKATNVSNSKAITLGGRQLGPQQHAVLNSNDEMTVGCFTFIVEISPGDPRAQHYEIKFVDISSASTSIPPQPPRGQILYSDPMAANGTANPSMNYSQHVLQGQYPYGQYAPGFIPHHMEMQGSPPVYQVFAQASQDMTFMPQGYPQTAGNRFAQVSQGMDQRYHPGLQGMHGHHQGFPNMGQGIPGHQGFQNIGQGHGHSYQHLGQGMPQNWQNPQLLQQMANLNLNPTRMPQENDEYPCLVAELPQNSHPPTGKM